MAKQAETKFKERVIADLRTLQGTWFFKTQEVSLHGIPDLIICIWGLFIAIELKRGKKERPDNIQSYTLGQIRKKAHGVTYVAFPENWDEIFEELKNMADFTEVA